MISQKVPQCIEILRKWNYEQKKIVVPSRPFLMRNITCTDDWFVSELAYEVGPTIMGHDYYYESNIKKKQHNNTTSMASHISRPDIVGVLCCAPPRGVSNVITSFNCSHDIFAKCLHWPDRFPFFNTLHRSEYKIVSPYSLSSNNNNDKLLSQDNDERRELPSSLEEWWGPVYLGFKNKGFRLGHQNSTIFLTKKAQKMYERLLSILAELETLS